MEVYGTGRPSARPTSTHDTAETTTTPGSTWTLSEWTAFVLELADELPAKTPDEIAEEWRKIDRLYAVAYRRPELWFPGRAR